MNEPQAGVPDTALGRKIADGSARIGVVGLGYVGLPLAVELAGAGLIVTGVDLDRGKADGVNAGHSHIPDVPHERVRELVDGGRLRAASDVSALSRADVVIICVPTPLSKTKDPDLSYVVAAAGAIAPVLGDGGLVVLESTTYPGTTEELILPILEGGGREVGRDFYLAFSPERVDPANRRYNIRNTPKVIGGVTEACTNHAAALYGRAIESVVRVSSTRAAEMVKLLENTFRSVNIGLVNEMALMCARLGIDVWEVIGAAATKPFGFMPFYPGPGLGGHCIPVDPLYLSWKLKTLNYRARFIELAGEINSAMPEYVVARINDALNEHRKSVRGARVLILGVAYKREVSDIRESPALDILRLLRARGATVSYHDPFVPELTLEGLELKSCDLREEVPTADIVVVVTDHADVDYGWVCATALCVLDTRNVTSGMSGKHLLRL